MSTGPELETLELEANGVRFSALACGKGPLALCAHGFPETAETFDRTLRHLAGMGYRAVAPHMRGYWPTAVQGTPSFQVVDLADDLCALAERLSSGGPAALVTHDWGAFAAYFAAAMRPALFRHVVTLGIPPVPMVRRTPGVAWGLRHFIAFQLRGPTVRRFRADDFAYVDHIYRRWSPTWRFGPEETAKVKEAFRHEGCLEHALSYYWHFARPPSAEGARRQKELAQVPVPVPVTVVLGKDDAAVTSRDLRQRPELFPGGLEVAWIDGAGHFIHREQPEAFFAVLDRVLKR
ncbi:MAG TPA: alpha/beta hydrolase [Myxococcaceae bacterium]|nr:alpha/beta hydrolase [Myxococcaceae bacterium]